MGVGEVGEGRVDEDGVWVIRHGVQGREVGDCARIPRVRTGVHEGTRRIGGRWIVRFGIKGRHGRCHQDIGSSGGVTSRCCSGSGSIDGGGRGERKRGGGDCGSVPTFERAFGVALRDRGRGERGQGRGRGERRGLGKVSHFLQKFARTAGEPERTR